MRQIEITQNVLDHLGYTQSCLVYGELTAFELVYSILNTSSKHRASKLLGTTRSLFDQICDSKLPTSCVSELLSISGIKRCSVCQTTKSSTQFYVSTCKLCADNRFNKSIPIWADSDNMASIYKRTPQGHHVDHIIPLMGDLVCGLHTEHNLYYKKFKEYNHGKA
jgi:hypothetical protein